MPCKVSAMSQELVQHYLRYDYLDDIPLKEQRNAYRNSPIVFVMRSQQARYIDVPVLWLRVCLIVRVCIR